MSAQYAVLLQKSAVVAMAREGHFPTPFLVGTGPRGEKGDPGGNIMSIGLFTDAGGLSIPVGTDAVRTSGHSITGLGIADYVADAAVDSAYVAAHPRTSFISTNGRSFRLDTSKGIDLFQVGGIADCTSPGVGSDNYPALVEAKSVLGRSGRLHIPSGGDFFFRCSQMVQFNAGIQITGEGWHQNPGLVNGVSYSYPRVWSGSIVCFDANTAGFQFVGPTDNQADSIVLEYQSAIYSSISDVFLLGGGGTSTAAHGLEFRICLFASNVRVESFSGNNVFSQANTGGSGSAYLYGNASNSVLRSVHSVAAGCHGFLIRGVDDNVITFISCVSSQNGGCAYFDVGFLGNNYLGCLAAINNQSHPANNGGAYSSGQRSYVIGDSGDELSTVGWAGLSDQYAGSFIVSAHENASHTYTGCYVEGPAQGYKWSIPFPATIVGPSGGFNRAARVDQPSGIHEAIFIGGEILAGIDQFQSRSNGFDFNDIIKINGVQVVGPRQPFPGYPTGGTVQDAEARTGIAQIWAVLHNHGLVA